jgi:hypothetical protein
MCDTHWHLVKSLQEILEVQFLKISARNNIKVEDASDKVQVSLPLSVVFLFGHFIDIFSNLVSYLIAGVPAKIFGKNAQSHLLDRV